MKTKIGAFFLAYLLFLIPAFPQGSLTPPGAPASTMKTLDQVEARTPIDPTKPGFTLPYEINARGSYYFTGNITASAATAGIRITTDNVSLDLNGFTLDGKGTGTSAILVMGPHSNIAVSNGALVGWGKGIDAGSCDNSQFAKLRITETLTGITLGRGDLLNDCSLFFKGASGGHGVVVQGNSIIRNCSVVGFSGDGYETGGYGTVENCVAKENGG